MDRQATFLLALGLLITAAAVVSVAGWVLFVRDRRAERRAGMDGDVVDPVRATDLSDPSPEG
jgi:hypothetical protein